MDQEQLAKKLFRWDHPAPSPFTPWARPAELNDLWPVDQEKYRQRAKELLDAGVVT